MIVRSVIVVAVCIIGTASHAARTNRTYELLGTDPLACQVLTNRYIYIHSTNTVHVDYGQIMSILHAEDLLTTVQDGYDAVLRPGEKKEWTIAKIGDGRYRFVNRKGETSEIFELYRSPADTNAFELAVLSQGRRFFGYYQALVHLRVTPDAAHHCAYSADIYAYPKNTVVRFVARNLNLIERFFNRKTDQIIEISTRVSLYLCSGAEVASLK